MKFLFIVICFVPFLAQASVCKDLATDETSLITEADIPQILSVVKQNGCTNYEEIEKNLRRNVASHGKDAHDLKRSPASVASPRTMKQ